MPFRWSQIRPRVTLQGLSLVSYRSSPWVMNRNWTIKLPDSIFYTIVKPFYPSFRQPLPCSSRHCHLCVINWLVSLWLLGFTRSTSATVICRKASWLFSYRHLKQDFLVLRLPRWQRLGACYVQSLWGDYAGQQKPTALVPRFISTEAAHEKRTKLAVP